MDNVNGAVRIEKEAKSFLLLLARKYEPIVLQCLHERREEKGSKPTDGWVNYGTILSDCAHPSDNAAVSKALNNLKAAGVIDNDGKKGRGGSFYKLNQEKYKLIIKIMNLTKQLINGI